MAIRTDTPETASTAIVLLVEDRGLCDFFPAILNATSIANAKHDVHVIGGAGWTEVYRRYDKLVDDGIDASRIIPILDADRLGEKGPRSKIHQNPQIFRFQVDFEFEFATGDCMLLDHALLFLLPDLFGEYGNVVALGTWSKIVRQALTNTLEQGGTTLDNVEKEICQRGIERAGLVMPSKVELSKVLLELCLETGAVPPEIDRLLLIVEARANDKPRPTTLAKPSAPRPLWESPYAASLPLPASSLTGKILFTSNNGELKCIHLSDQSTITTITKAENLSFNACLPDGRLAATRGSAEGVVITSTENVADQVLLSHGVREHFLCWHQQENRVLLASAHTGKIFSVSEDNSSWHPIHTPDRNSCNHHCINNRGFLAWAAYSNSGFRTVYVRPLHEDDDKRVSVPDVIDARYLVWSHNGYDLAFVNSEVGTDRRSVCIWNRVENRTRFILPWIGKPLRIAWSPDDQYIVFQLDRSNASQEPGGLFLVPTQSNPRTRAKILRLSSQGGDLLYDAWQS